MPPRTTDLSGAPEGADRRHDVNRLDAPGLPLLVQNVGALHDLLPVGVEHALQENSKAAMKRLKRWIFSKGVDDTGQGSVRGSYPDCKMFDFIYRIIHIISLLSQYAS